MDIAKTTATAPKGASALNFEKLSDHIEAQGGLLAQTDAVQHMSTMLNAALQRKLCDPRREENKLGYVQAQFSVEEIDRLIWLAGEIQERGIKLSAQVDALYGDLTDIGNAASGRSAL